MAVNESTFATKPVYAFSNSFPTRSWQVRSSIPRKKTERYHDCFRLINRLWNVLEPVFAYKQKSLFKNTTNGASLLKRWDIELFKLELDFNLRGFSLN